MLLEGFALFLAVTERLLLFQRNTVTIQRFNSVLLHRHGHGSGFRHPTQSNPSFPQPIPPTFKHSWPNSTQPIDEKFTHHHNCNVTT